MVFVDPVTRQIRQPSPEEIGSLAAAASAQQATSPKPLVTMPSPRGGVLAILDDSQMSYLVVTRQPDGKLREQCVTGGEKAAEVVASPPEGLAPTTERREVRDAH